MENLEETEALNECARNIMSTYATITNEPNSYLDWLECSSLHQLYGQIRYLGIEQDIDDPHTPPTKELCRIVNPLLQKSGTTLETLYAYNAKIKKHFVKQGWNDMQSNDDADERAHGYRVFHDSLDVLKIEPQSPAAYEIYGMVSQPKYHAIDRKAALSWIREMIGLTVRDPLLFTLNPHEQAQIRLGASKGDAKYLNQIGQWSWPEVPEDDRMQLILEYYNVNYSNTQTCSPFPRGFD